MHFEKKQAVSSMIFEKTARFIVVELYYSCTRLLLSHNTPLVMIGETINQSAAKALNVYTITEPAALAAPKIVETRLKSNKPNKPQFTAPTITKI